MLLKWKRVKKVVEMEEDCWDVELLRWERVMEGGDDCMVVEVGVIMERVVKVKRG